MRTARFIPQDDITVLELARVVAVIITGINRNIEDVEIKFPGEENSNFDKFIANYSDILRHFEISEEV